MAPISRCFLDGAIAGAETREEPSDQLLLRVQVPDQLDRAPDFDTDEERAAAGAAVVEAGWESVSTGKAPHSTPAAFAVTDCCNAMPSPFFPCAQAPRAKAVSP